MTLTPSSRNNLVIVSVAFLTCLLIIHSALYHRHVPDDSFISFQYVKRFVAGHGLTWTEGRPVEGYTNLLWVLLLASLAALGFSITVASQALGLSCMIIALFCMTSARLRSVGPSESDDRAGFVAGLFFVTCGLTAAWAMGGLEQALIAALLSVALVTFYGWFEGSRTKAVVFCVVLALLPLTRPDMALFSVILGGFIFLFGRSQQRQSLLVFLPFIVSIIGVTTFRLWYYGDFVPNTAHVKMPFSYAYFVQGARYVLRGYGLLFPLLIPFFGLLFISVRFAYERRLTWVIATLVAAWSAYMMVMGGDVNPPSRHFVPIVVLLAFALRLFVHWVFSYGSPQLRRDTQRFGAGLFLFFLLLQTLDAELRYARGTQEYSQSDALSVGHLLKKAFGKHDPLLALDGAGAVPFSSELRVLDLLGLNDYHIAHNPPKDFGQGWLAHELGDPAYVLERAPDLVLFGSYKGAWEGAFGGGKKLVSLPEFQARYQRARLLSETTPPFYIQLWVALRGKGGIIESPSEVTIPAHLIDTQGEIPLLFDPIAERLVAVATSKHAEAQLPRISLAPLNWRVSISPPCSFDINGEGITVSGQIVRPLVPSPAIKLLFQSGRCDIQEVKLVRAVN